MSHFWNGFEKRAEDSWKEKLKGFADKGYLYDIPFIGPYVGGAFTGSQAPEGKKLISAGVATGTAAAVERVGSLMAKAIIEGARGPLRIKAPREGAGFLERILSKDMILKVVAGIPGGVALHETGKFLHGKLKDDNIRG